MRGRGTRSLLDALVRHAKRIAHDIGEVGVVGSVGEQHRLERGIHLDGDDARRLLHERERERTDARPHLEHALRARKLGKLADALDHMVVDEEVLTELVLGGQPELVEQFARRGKVS